MALRNTRQLLTVKKNQIAYFSMEIGFRSDIPTYSGGLGVLAGDTLKSFADLGIDVVAVTLLNEKGYFKQNLDEWGYQREEYNSWPFEKELEKLDVTVNVFIENRVVKVTAWRYNLIGVKGKKVSILFLDTNINENHDEDKGLTSHLYGGDNLYRLRQEIVLGIGGIKILRELGYNPRKYHMNEGHAAFLILELYRELHSLSDDKGVYEEEKKRILQELCSFTTHTPVAAGHDVFPNEMIEKQLGSVMPKYIFDLVSRDGKFNMTLLALNYSSYVNAVARKHQEVSKRMFPEFHIHYITNGVHSTTWVNDRIAALFDKHIIDWRVNPLELRNSYKIPLEELQSAHQKTKQDLFDYIKETQGVEFDVNVFTIGFARRATGYKRAELLFRNIEWLKHISRTVGKIQLVFAGKAHPRDDHGKHIIQHIINLSKELSPTVDIVFLENYCMDVSLKMVSGVDLWLNTPKRPLEASGTSGMKATHNGVPSLSIPDGWWVEGLIEGVTGWGIGQEIITEHDDNKIDEMDANDLYEKLEKHIVPLYYNDPMGYVAVMRNAIAINAAYFNTHRMVNQYLVGAYARNNKV